jgi:cytoskeletal protein RodZ
MASFGKELRRERELRRISLREVAEATKVNLRYLQALENDDFEQLPGGVFNRGFVRAYAQFVGIDPDDWVNAYLLQEKDQDGQEKERERGPLRRTRPLPPRIRIEPAGGPASRRILAWSVVVIVLIAVVISLFLFLRRTNESPSGAPAGNERPVESSLSICPPEGQSRSAHHIEEPS